MSTKRAKRHKELVATERWIKEEMRLDDRTNMDFIRSIERFSRWLRRNEPRSKGRYVYMPNDHFEYVRYFKYLWYLKDERPKIIPSLWNA